MFITFSHSKILPKHIRNKLFLKNASDFIDFFKSHFTKIRKVEKKEPHKIRNKFKNNTQIIPEQTRFSNLDLFQRK